MTSCDEKKFPPSPAAIKIEALNGKRRRLKIMIAAAIVVMAALVGGAIFLGIHLNGQPIVTRSLNFWDGKQLLHETVETDKIAETDAFYTEGSKGEAVLVYDHHKLMKAFKFSRSETCFVIEETLDEKKGVRKAAEDLEAKQDGSVQFARSCGAMVMSVDTDRPDRPVLSEKLQNFCGQLEPSWAKLTPATEEEEQQMEDRMEMIMPAASAADKTADALRDHRVKRLIRFRWMRFRGRTGFALATISMAPDPPSFRFGYLT